MPQFFEWIMDHFFIVVIIAGALLSVFGKKNAKPNGSEPFGGRAASRQNPTPRQIQTADRQEQRRSPFAGAPSPNEANSDNRKSLSAQRSAERQVSRGMNAQVQKRVNEQRAMHGRSRSVENAAKEIERAVAGTPSRNAPASGKKTPTSSAPASSRTLSAASADELRKGVMWAEILGAPRARKPHSSGRR